MMPLRKCVFFDRDGIVNRVPDPERYVLTWEAFHVNPEFPRCLQVVAAQGYEAAIVTNQRCISQGLISVAALEEMHDRLRGLLRVDSGAQLLDIVFCPHDRGVCACRKPLPGMLLGLAEKHGLDLGRSWMVGDAETDVETGRAAGCRTLRVAPLSLPSQADIRVASLSDLPGVLSQALDDSGPLFAANDSARPGASHSKSRV